MIRPPGPRSSYVPRSTRRRTIASALASLAGVLGLVLGVPTTAHAYVDIATASLPAPVTLKDGATIDLLSIAFTTTASDEPHRIYPKLVSRVPTSAAGAMMLAYVKVKCWGPGESEPGAHTDYSRVFVQQRNVLRGETSTLSLRWTYIAHTPGTHRCEMQVHTIYPRDPGSSSSNVLVAETGTDLRATSTLHPAQQQLRIPLGSGEVLSSSNVSKNFMNRTWTAPSDISEFAVNADVMVTSCTSLGDDPGCEGHVNRDGGIVNTMLVVEQYATSMTSYCRVFKLPTSSGMNTGVSRDRHHETIRNAGSFTVSTDPACSRTFRIYLNAKWVSGAGIVMHDYSAVSAVVPAG